MSVPEAHGGSTSRRFFVLLSAAAFCSAAGARIADPLLPNIAEEFNVSVGSAAVVATGFTMAYGLCQIFWGLVGDRIGKFRLVAIVTLCAAFATALCGFTDSIGTLGAARLLSGALSAAIIPLSLAHIADNVPYALRQPVLARFLSGQVLGIISSQAAGGILAVYVGWRGVLLALAAVYFVVGLLLVLGIKAQTQQAGTATRGLSDLIAGYGELARSSKVRRVLGTAFAEGVLFFGAFTYVGAYLRQRYGVGYDGVGALLASFGVGSLFYMLGASYIVARLGEAKMVMSGGAILALAFLLMAIHPAVWVLPLPIMLCGLGYYLFHNTLQTHATQMAPAIRGSAVSIFSACFFLGQATGVTGFGHVIEYVGYGPMFITAAVLLPALAWLFKRIAIDARPDAGVTVRDRPRFQT
jgi:predicted MFS family arabinose efflux permease